MAFLGLVMFYFIRTSLMLANNRYKVSNEPKRQSDGFVVLGMHRSGTSMLTGSLYTAAGYAYGEEIRAVKGNAKGTFELLPFWSQNDLLMEHQGRPWDRNVLAYDSEQALKDIETGAVPFELGEQALDILENTPENVPWILKDPRLCVTFPTWRKIFKKEPAVLFTYRNPLEVARSLEARDEKVRSWKKNRDKGLEPLTLTRGLKLWIAYNQLAIQNSKGLCMVRTTKPAVMAAPVQELQRISDYLTNECGVAAPPKRVSQADVEEFIDTELSHQKAEDREVMKKFNGGTCLAHVFESKLEEGSPEAKEERNIYLMAMRVFCDLESGVAFEDNYKWPKYSIKD